MKYLVIIRSSLIDCIITNYKSNMLHYLELFKYKRIILDMKKQFISKIIIKNEIYGFKLCIYMFFTILLDDFIFMLNQFLSISHSKSPYYQTFILEKYMEKNHILRQVSPVKQVMMLYIWFTDVAISLLVRQTYMMVIFLKYCLKIWFFSMYFSKMKVW